MVELGDLHLLALSDAASAEAAYRRALEQTPGHAGATVQLRELLRSASSATFMLNFSVHPRGDVARRLASHDGVIEWSLPSDLGGGASSPGPLERQSDVRQQVLNRAKQA
jgi:hypothetical protein